jgi:hypothetical protein
MRGSRKMAWSSAGFPMRCARTVTEPFELRPSYAALQNSVPQAGYPVIGRIDSQLEDSLASRSGAVSYR